TEIADRVSKIDFSQYMGTVEAVFNKVEGFVSFLIGAIQTAWRFRGVIFAIVGVMAAYRTMQLLIVGAGKLFVFWVTAKKAAIFLTTLFTGSQTAALALLEAGTLKHLIVSKAFAVAEKIKTVIMSIAT
ncbi:hypothetical protein, partial [Treponema sp. R6D11]